MPMCVYVCMYHNHIMCHVYVYIYIYIERERERERDHISHVMYYMYVYIIYIYIACLWSGWSFPAVARPSPALLCRRLRMAANYC